MTVTDAKALLPLPASLHSNNGNLLDGHEQVVLSAMMSGTALLMQPNDFASPVNRTICEDHGRSPPK